MTISSTEKRYKKSKDTKKNIVLTFRTAEDGRPKESYYLNFNEYSKSSKRRDRYFVKQLAKEGELDEILSPDDLKRALSDGVLPPPYVVDYKVPLDLGGAGKLRNMYVVDANVAELMDALYWHQIRLELRAFKDRYKGQQPPDRILVSFATLPKLFTQQKFLEYVLPHERKELQRYLSKKVQQDIEKNEKVSVQTLADGNVLWSLMMPEKLPKGMKMAIVQVNPRLWVERRQVRSEYAAMRSKMVLASLRRGDFKDLPVEMQRQIRRTERVPSAANRTCHHILPLALGGENKMQNVCWLDDRIHKLIHQKFISPFEARMHGMATLPENLFFEMPVPVNAQIERYRLVQGVLQPVAAEKPQLKKTLKNASKEPKFEKRKNKKHKRFKLPPFDPQNEA